MGSRLLISERKLNFTFGQGSIAYFEAAFFSAFLCIIS